jgi:hypothetical protein
MTDTSEGIVLITMFSFTMGFIVACIEPLCRCRMSAKQVRNAVSYYALKQGKVVRIRMRDQQ